jgi:ribose 5-phosphate isomerase B
MEIYLATDHAGFQLKEAIKAHLIKQNYNVIDCGAFTVDENDDYPLFISKAAKAVSEDPEGRRAIVLGGSGTGEAIVANRFDNVRAALFNGGPRDTVELSREHNDANVLSLGARFIDEAQAISVVEEWLSTPFSGDERHVRRIEEIEEVSE